MEFVDRFFGIRKRRQEKLLAEMGISGELRKELAKLVHLEGGLGLVSL